jgi:hypothetical protein
MDHQIRDHIDVEAACGRRGEALTVEAAQSVDLDGANGRIEALDVSNKRPRVDERVCPITPEWLLDEDPDTGFEQRCRDTPMGLGWRGDDGEIDERDIGDSEGAMTRR